MHWTQPPSSRGLRVGEPIALGTQVEYADEQWTVEMIGCLQGERYYWLAAVNDSRSVAMLPAELVESNNDDQR